MSKWEMARLGDVGTFINGFAFKPDDWCDAGLPIIRIQNLNDDKAAFNYFNGKVIDKYYVDNDDVLISWSASLGVFKWKRGKALLNQHIFKVVFNKIDIAKDFFIYAIKKMLNEMERQTHGSTMKHITKGKFDNMLFPLPPLETQNNIAKTLDAASEVIALHKKQLAELDSLIKSIFYDMFGDPVVNDMGWEFRKLGELGELNRGVSKHRPRNAPELLGGIHPLIQTGDIAKADLYMTTYNQTYSDLGLKQSKKWNKGILCITIAANIAKTAILEIDACFPDSVVAFNANIKTNNLFIHFWFGFFQKILENQAPESAQKNINLRILNDLNVIVPPLPLQQKFADIVTKIEEQKDIVKKAIDESQYLLDSLMSESFE